MTDIASLGIKVSTSGVDQAKTQLDGLAKSSDTAAAAAKKASDNWQKNTFSPTKLYSANKALGDYKRALEAAAAAGAAVGTKAVPALEKTAKAMSTTGRSAKELQFAARGLPAQFTDIATSLASGQRPLQVLLQQGGQIKDMFGGIGPAIRAMGGYLLGLINPFTITAGLVAALFLAWKQGSDEAVKFNQAIALTGNFAGTTAAQLEAMSVSMAQVNGTQHEAAGALAEVVRSGKFAADQLQFVAQAALDMEKATGQAVEDTVKQFARLAKDPLDAAVELNKQYHFLTEAVYEQIKSLKEQGREEEAATLAMKTYSGELSKRAQGVVDNAGYMEKAWRGLSAAARQAWSDMLNAGRASTAVSQAQLKIESARSGLSAIARNLRGQLDRGQVINATDLAANKRAIATFKAQIAEAQKVIGADTSTLEAAKKASRQRANDTAIALSEEADKYKDAALKRAERIAAIQTQANKAVAQAIEAGDQELAKRIRASEQAVIAGINAETKQEPAKGGGGGGRGGSGRAVPERDMPDFSKNAAADALALAEAEDRATQSFLDMQATLQGPLAEALRDHNLRVEHLNALAAQSPVAAAGLNEALDLEAKRYAEVAKAIEAAQNPLQLLLEDMQFELDMIGKSNAERAVMIELRRANIDAMSKEGQAAIETAKAFDEEARNKQRSIDLMDDFRSGASNALADIVTGAKSAKEAFADFFNDLSQRIIQMISERWIEKAFGAMGTSEGGSAGGGLMAAFSALFGGGRAMGGPVSGKRFYEVGERDKPELLHVRGRSYLIPGNQGTVEPMSGQRSGPVTNYYQTAFYVPDISSRRNQQQVADRTQREQSRSASRNR